jgi:hypothetical protein
VLRRAKSSDLSFLFDGPGFIFTMRRAREQEI